MKPAPYPPETRAQTYSQKLLDPRWQRKRLEVFQRANFTCERCGATGKTLNAHHRAYFRGREPWDYLADQLECVCVDCHDKGADQDALVEVAACAGRQQSDITRDGVAAILQGVLYCDESPPRDFVEDAAGLIAVGQIARKLSLFMRYDDLQRIAALSAPEIAALLTAQGDSH